MFHLIFLYSAIQNSVDLLLAKRNANDSNVAKEDIDILQSLRIVEWIKEEKMEEITQ